jgi:hypothetical protein
LVRKVSIIKDVCDILNNLNIPSNIELSIRWHPQSNFLKYFPINILKNVKSLILGNEIDNSNKLFIESLCNLNKLEILCILEFRDILSYLRHYSTIETLVFYNISIDKLSSFYRTFIPVIDVMDTLKELFGADDIYNNDNETTLSRNVQLVKTACLKI